MYPSKWLNGVCLSDKHKQIYSDGLFTVNASKLMHIEYVGPRGIWHYQVKFSSVVSIITSGILTAPFVIWDSAPQVHCLC